MAKFDESGCQMVNSKNKVIATAKRCGSYNECGVISKVSEPTPWCAGMCRPKTIK